MTNIQLMETNILLNMFVISITDLLSLVLTRHNQILTIRGFGLFLYIKKNDIIVLLYKARLWVLFLIFIKNHF